MVENTSARFLAAYRRFFAVEEIQESKTLQWIFGILLVGFLFLLQALITEPSITAAAIANNSYVCWPWFPHCEALHILSGLPFGYSQGIAGALIFASLAASFYFVTRAQWLFAHIALTLPYGAFLILMYVVEMRGGIAFGDHLMILATLFLFFRNKIWLLRYALVLLYLFSALTKIHEGWILGTYFSSLHLSLPLFPSFLSPIVSNLVICMMSVGALMLLSTRENLRYAAIGFFVFFHIYAVIFTGLTYSLVVIPLLALLFIVYEGVDRRVRIGAGALIFFVLLTLLQLVPLAIPGDAKLTQEGALFAFHGFDANHQCRSMTTRHFTDGTKSERLFESPYASKRCDPYDFLQNIQGECRKRGESLERMSWTLDTSINGGPYYRIVDVSNACTLAYKVFGHNEWIRLQPVPVGSALENLYLP